MKYKPASLVIAEGIVIFAYKTIDTVVKDEDMDSIDQFLLIKVASIKSEDEVTRAICAHGAICADLNVRSQPAEDIFGIEHKKGVYKICLG